MSSLFVKEIAMPLAEVLVLPRRPRKILHVFNERDKRWSMDHNRPAFQLSLLEYPFLPLFRRRYAT